ncbi:MAG: hypothetical protein QM503_00060 [Bacteroidota bacterium]
MKTIILCLSSLLLLVSFTDKPSQNNYCSINYEVDYKFEYAMPLLPEKGYAELTKNVDGGYIQIYTYQDLKVHYIQEYNFATGDFYNSFIYRIYNEDREIVVGYDSNEGVMIGNVTIFNLSYGDNFIPINCDDIGYGNFLMEVDSPKGEKLYLKLKRSFANPS